MDLEHGKTLSSDINQYHKAYAAYVKNFYKCPSVYDVGEDKFQDVVTSQLNRTTSTLKVLGVGSGTGELDCIIFKRFLGNGYTKIENTVVEPSTYSLGVYKSLIANQGQLSESVDTEWHQKPFQQYREERERQQCNDKFHFISAIHSMYYMDDLGDYTNYLIGLLEKDGILLIAILDDDCGFRNVSRRFPDLHGPILNECPTKYIMSALDYKEVKADVFPMKHQSDITSCFEESSTEGSLILDFITKVIDCRKIFSSELLNTYLEYLKTSDCSEILEDGKILFREPWAAIVIKKT